jgi:dodecin
MSVAKVVHIVASSERSFEDAVQKGLASAAQSLRGIHGLKITDWTASVEDNKIVSYKVTMDIAFGVERT